MWKMQVVETDGGWEVHATDDDGKVHVFKGGVSREHAEAFINAFVDRMVELGGERIPPGTVVQ